MPVLHCKMFLDSEKELFYDDPYDIDDPTVSWLLGQGAYSPAQQIAAAAVPIPKHGIIIAGAIIAQLVLSTTSILEKESAKRLARGIDTLLVELCASDDSDLIKQVPYRPAVIWITENENLTHSQIAEAIRTGIRSMHSMMHLATHQ